MSDRNDDGDEFGLVSQAVGGLPIVNHVVDRLRLPALLADALPDDDGRLKLAPAVAIRLVITNLALGREPLYGLGEWAARYDPTLLGLSSGELGLLNDDRVGRALEALFDADRASLLTAVVLRAISEFGIETRQFHNDSTSISVHGAYRDAVGTERGGKPTPVITFGHSKDHRPDLKQLVWILTVSADGAVPMAYRLADGNTSDDPTHVPTWDGLVDLLGRTDFLYVADSKLCSRAAMGHIAGRGGRFVTILPRSRAEDGAFRHWLQTHTPTWTQAARRPADRPAEPAQDPDRGRAGRDRRTDRHPRREVGHVHPQRDHHHDLQAGTRRQTRTRDELPGDPHQPLHGQRRHLAGPRRPRRRQRRLLPADQQRPRPERRRRARRLPLPAEAGTPPPPAQERPRRRPGAAAQPSPDRGTVLLPVPGTTHLRVDRT